VLDGPSSRPPGAGRLPFRLQPHAGGGTLALADLAVGALLVERLELEVSDLGSDPGAATAERFQRRRTRLRQLAVRLTREALADRVEQARRPLTGLGISQLSARLGDGFVSIRARAADGLAAADVSFRLALAHTGGHLRALASTIRVHGHLPTPGPVIADRVCAALLGATETATVVERPRTRGLCDVEVDLIGGVLWHLLPPNGWRLPTIADLELTALAISRTGVEVAFGPAGSRAGELGVRHAVLQLAAAHDLMHAADELVREGQIEEGMRGYRALLAAGGPDQPLLLERILALAAARSAWFFDGLELARQALGRWPAFPPAHAALASITLAQGDAREAAGHLMRLAQLASAEGDDDQATLAALAGARLLRVVEPRSATQLYQLALEHDPASEEAADALADRLADEQRWPELVRLLQARAEAAPEPARAVQLRLRLADVLVHQQGDLAAAQRELAAARAVAPDEPAVHEMTAAVLTSHDPVAAVDAWRAVARLGEERGDHRTAARAWAALGDLLARLAPAPGGTPRAPGAPRALDPAPPRPRTAGVEAQAAWRRAIELDPLQSDALVGLAAAAAATGEHAAAVVLFERLRGLGLGAAVTARHELQLARSLAALGRLDEARSSLRRATLAGGETAAEAHALLAEIATGARDRDLAAAELEAAIAAFVELAVDERGEAPRRLVRAAKLALTRAQLLEVGPDQAAAVSDLQRAYQLAQAHDPDLARAAASALLERAGSEPAVERRWIDALLATRPRALERASLLVRRADSRLRDGAPDLAAALADVREALPLLADPGAAGAPRSDPHAAVRAAHRRALALEAELLARRGDLRARAQAVAAIAALAGEPAPSEPLPAQDEAAAAAAWLAAGDSALALAHGARAVAALGPGAPAALRVEALALLGEAAWRQRAWGDAMRAYRELGEALAAAPAAAGASEPADASAPAVDPGEVDGDPASPHPATARYRLAVAADRGGEPAVALAALHPIVDGEEAARAVPPQVRGPALRLYADLAERLGDLPGAAAALECFAALSVESSTTARADATYRAGELFRRADRGDDAIRCLDATLRLSDAHLPALDALETAWRERGDLERVATILGRKIAATARHPARQKPLLSRLGELQAQLGRPDVARAAHQRALEIDPAWRPSLRFVTIELRGAGKVVEAATGLAQLAGELPGDPGVDLAIVAHERQLAAIELARLVGALDRAQLDAIREVALPALERAALVTAEPGADPGPVRDALARLRGETAPAPGDGAAPSPLATEGSGPARASSSAHPREVAARARAAGNLALARTTLERAHQAAPLDAELLRDLVDLTSQLGEHRTAARHLEELAEALSGARRGDALLELADVCFDRLDDAPRGRRAMRAAASAFGAGARHDAALRLLASEAGTSLAWDVAVEALSAIAPARRARHDVAALAHALRRAGRDGDAIAIVEEATATGRFADGGALLEELRAEVARKAALADALEARARTAAAPDAIELRAEARALREALGASERAAADGLAAAPRAAAAPLGRATARIAIEDPDAGRARTKTDRGLGARDKSPAGGDDAAAPSDRGEAAPSATPPGRSRPLARIQLVPGESRERTTRERIASAPRAAAAAAPAGEDAPLRSDDPDAGWAIVTGARAGRATEPPPVAPPPGAPPPATPPPVAPPPVAPPPLIPPPPPARPALDAPEPALEPARPAAAAGARGGPAPARGSDAAAGPSGEPAAVPSVVITGSPEETARALAAALAAADRSQLIAAHRASPSDAGLLLALLAHLGDGEPATRRQVLEGAARDGRGRAQAIALHELALHAREAREPVRAAALWTRAHEADPDYAPVWMPLAGALAAAEDLHAAGELYERVAAAADADYDPARRAFAADRAAALLRDDAVVSGELARATAPAAADPLAEARRLGLAGDPAAALAAAERAAADAAPGDLRALELIEQLSLEAGDLTAASAAIGRQLAATTDPARQAVLWCRRARIYRDALGRDAEAYRCLKEAQACAPADPEIAYQLRVAAMVRGEWPLAAQVIHREIAAARTPRDRGALHLELALICDERLGDHVQAQENYELALGLDPTIPAAKLPLARRYDAIGRFADAARLYEEAAATARASDRAALLAAAAAARAAAAAGTDPDRVALLERVDAEGDLDRAHALATEVWRASPGDPTAFRVLAKAHRAAGDLPALTELTSVRASHAEAPGERATAWLEVARLAEELGATPEAARAYDLALIEDPGHTGALDARGALAFRIGDYATADLIYRDLAPAESALGDDELALRRSIVAEQLGRDTEALAHAQAAALAAPGRRDVAMRVQELATRIGELPTAIAAARTVLDLVPLDDDEGQLAIQFAIIELLREAGDLDGAIAQLDRVLRDHPVHVGALETLADLHIARGDWPTATRYLYQLVPLAPTQQQRAERLYRLGDAVLVHLGDTDRADDVFLRASDLDPTHIPTLRRLLDVYWRADDPAALVEVASELVSKAALAPGTTPPGALAHALVAAGLLGDAPLASRVAQALGDEAPRRVAVALVELAGRDGRLALPAAATAVTELARRGILDLARLRAAASGTPAASLLDR
jgi:Tfp pilus assembly protein PilF